MLALLGDPDSSHAHAGTYAHTRKTDLLSTPPQLVQQRTDLPGSSAAKGVSERNSATLGVDLLGVQSQLVGTPQTLAGERLVDLEDVHIVLGNARLLKDLGDRLPGADTHEQRLDADDGSRDVLAQDGLSELLGRRSLHQEHGGGTVRDLGCIAGVDGAVLGKSALHLAQGLLGHAGAHTVVLGHGDSLGLAGLGVLELDGQGVDLLVKEAGCLCLGGLLIRCCGEGVLVLTLNVTVRSHLFGEDAHGHLAVGGFRVRFEELGEFRDGGGAALLSVSTCSVPFLEWIGLKQRGYVHLPVLSAHALNTGADADLDHAALDLVGDIDTRLQTARALSVESSDGRRLGETSYQGSGAHLGGATAGGQNLSDADILDQSRVNLGPLKDALQGTCQQVRGLCVLEAALAALGECSSETCRYYDLRFERPSVAARADVESQGETMMRRATHIVRALNEEALLCGLGASDLVGDLL